jgi:hypothetical protein
LDAIPAHLFKNFPPIFPPTGAAGAIPRFQPLVSSIFLKISRDGWSAGIGRQWVERPPAALESVRPCLGHRAVYK